MPEPSSPVPPVAKAPLLEARGVTKTFRPGRGLLGLGPKSEPNPVLHGVDLVMDYGEVTGLIGESGSGKTTFGKCLLRIVQPDSGTVRLEGDDFIGMDAERLRERRARYQMIYQNPYACLNPGLTVRAHLRETLAVHRGIQGGEADALVKKELARFGMEDKADSYPGELSGGEKRRISVARTLLTQPLLVVADEPTSGLDASVKADVLDAMLFARDDRTAYLFISHDLDVIRFVSDRILVMYRGRIVEVMEKERIDPQLPHHPYTVRLFQAARSDVPDDDEVLGESGPSLDPQKGCPYRSLCHVWHRRGRPDDACVHELPALLSVHSRQTLACHVLAAQLLAGAGNGRGEPESPSSGPAPGASQEPRS